MKEKNTKLKIFFIALLFIIMPLILFNNSYALELNEEYVKEDFKFEKIKYGDFSGEKEINNLTEQGEEKVKKNNGILVIDADIVGEVFCINIDDNNDIIKEIYLKNLEKATEIYLPGYCIIEKINFEGCSNAEIICNLSHNANLTDIDMYSLKSLKILGNSDEYNELPGAYSNHFCYNNLSNVRLNPELEVIGDDAFSGNGNLKDLDISYLKKLKKVSDVAFAGNNTRLHVAYKNPLGLKDAEKIYKDDDNYNLSYSSFNDGQPINGHVIVDDVQNRLDEVTEDKKLAEITTEEEAKLDEIKDIIKKQFASEEELNTWLKEKGFDEREKKILEDNKVLGEKIDAKLEEIRNLEPYAKTNEELLQELDEVVKEIEEYNKKYNELNDLYIEEIKELLAKEKADKEDLNKKLTDLQAEKDKELKAKQDTINHLNELIDKLNKEADENKKKISELENSVKELQAEKTKVEAEKAMLENTLAETKDMLEAAEKNNDKASEEIMNLKNKIAETEEKFAKCKEHCKKLEEELNNTKADLKNEQEENAKLNEKIKKLEAEKAELASKNKELIEKEEERKKQEELEKSKEELEKQKEEREKRQQEAKEERAKAENNGSVTTNTKSTNKNNTKSNNKLPYAGSESVITLSLITICAIVYTKRVMKRK